MTRLTGIVCVGVLAAACAETTANVEPEVGAAQPHVSAVAALPVFLGFGKPIDQRRAQRRSEDALIALSGGRAILTSELRAGAPAGADAPEIDDRQIAESARALGEKPEEVLTFAIVASRGQRTVPNASPIPGFGLGRRMIMDYIVRLEVRRAGKPDVLGTIDAIATGEPNGSEIGPHGESLGVQKAIDDALARAVHTFAPGLEPGGVPEEGGAGGVLIAEVPAAAGDSAAARSKALQELYPELSIGEMHALVSSRQRLLVIRPGTLVGLGLAPGDLVGLPVGQPLGSRAELVRGLARGRVLKVVVERGGQRYLLASARN
jgi:hypothetical protein